MTEKIKELLAVLDMPEEEQWDWVVNKVLKYEGWSFYQNKEGKYGVNEEATLADLAFRLRDEVVGLKKLEKRDSGDYDIEHRLYRNAMAKVYDCVNHTTVFYSQNPPQKYFIWWIETAQPIHWIIAALIAKALAKSGKTKNGETKS